MTARLSPPPPLEPAGDDDWRKRAQCRDRDPEMFFAEGHRTVKAAKAVCRSGCPVRAQCLAYALDSRQPYGVWGGELFVNGVVVNRDSRMGPDRRSGQ